ncbi:MAG: hypothetical protein HY719_11130, partial [Planctomycetes bacterium]|nr:hypothetical protein [Planctomycetota bacterium]
MPDLAALEDFLKQPGSPPKSVTELAGLFGGGDQIAFRAMLADLERA